MLHKHEAVAINRRSDAGIRYQVWWPDQLWQSLRTSMTKEGRLSSPLHHCRRDSRTCGSL